MKNRFNRLVHIALLCILASGICLPGWVQESTDEFKSIADVVKDAKKFEGFYTLYKKDSNLFMEIPSSQMEKEFMLSTSVARGIAQGSIVAGMTLTESIYYWKEVDKKIYLMEKNIRHIAKAGDPIQEAVKENFGDSTIAVFAIRAKSGGTSLIDLGDFLFTDYLEIGSELGGYSLDRNRSVWGMIKTFPRNIEVEVDATFTGRGGGDLRTVPDSRYLPVTLHYSLSQVPQSTGYRPRPADDRIGYFLTAKKDYSKKGSEEPFVRYINRWHLEKADPSAELSPPKKPIVFYIDKNVPYEYRPMIREGMLEWNKAFEKAGFINAIEVRYQEEDANWDAEDINYNTVRWMTGEIGYAIGPSRTNPHTGEIYDADILVDSYWLQVFEWQYEVLVDEHEALSAAKVEAGKGPLTLGEFIQQIQQRGLGTMADADTHALCRCEYAKGLTQQMAIAAAAAIVNEPTKEKKKGVPEEYIQQGLKDLIMHEFGHTLGLRHNFKSSAMIPLADLDDKAKAETNGLVGSVMDYDLANIAPPGTTQNYYFTPTLGAWDYLVIEYGYKVCPDSELPKIAAKASQPPYLYATDGDAGYGIDPLSNRRDMSDDLIGFAKRRIEVMTALWKILADKMVDEGEGYQKLRSAFLYTLNDLQSNMYHASRYVGGFNISRDHKGDPDESPALAVVPAAKQRESLDFVCNMVLQDSVFQFDPALLARLAPNRWDHWGSSQSSLNVPVHDWVLSGQLQILSRLFSSGVLNRVHEGQLYVKPGDDLFTLDEIYTKVTCAVWSELNQDLDSVLKENKPFLSSHRRDLQRAYMQYILLDQVLNPSFALPMDARAMAWSTVNGLKAKIDSVLNKLNENPSLKMDGLSLAHLKEIQARIQKAQDSNLFMQTY